MSTPPRGLPGWRRSPQISGQAEMAQDLFGHLAARTPEASGGRVGNRCDQPQPPGAIRASQHVDLKRPA